MQLASRGPPLIAIPRTGTAYNPFFQLTSDYRHHCSRIKDHLDRFAVELYCTEIGPEESFAPLKKPLKAELKCEYNDSYCGAQGFQLSVRVKIGDIHLAYLADVVTPWGFLFEEFSSTIMAGLLAGDAEFQDAIAEAVENGLSESTVIESIEVISCQWKENISILADVEVSHTPFLKLV